MKTILLKAAVNSRFHFGKMTANNDLRLNNSSNYAHSDTLFSALINNVASYAPSKVEGLIQLFEEKKVGISSLFYCLQHQQTNKTIWFVPKPIHASNLLSEMDGIKASGELPKPKQIKKIQFVSLGILKENVAPSLWDNKNETVQLGKGFVCTSEEAKIANGNCTVPNQLFCSNEIATHVNMRPDDLQKTSDPYQFSFLQIPEEMNGWKSDFYFLMDDSKLNELEKKMIHFAINLIRLNGIGGKRNSGYGWIQDVEIKDSDPLFYNNTSEQNCAMTLGVSIPENKENFEKYQFYSIENRGGRVTASSRTKSIPMIMEGAVLSNASQTIGKMVDISDDENNENSNPTYRLGSCLTLQIPISYANNC